MDKIELYLDDLSLDTLRAIKNDLEPCAKFVMYKRTYIAVSCEVSKREYMERVRQETEEMYVSLDEQTYGSDQ